MNRMKTNVSILKCLTMYGIILFHHFSTRIPNRFIKLTDGFKYESYYYDYINNIRGAVSKVSLIMDFLYGHLGNGGNLIFMFITGYFLFGRKIPYSKRIHTVGKVLFALFFNGVILTFIYYFMFKFFYPSSFNETFRPLFQFPNWISGENQWYLQAYGIFILFVLPVLKLFEPLLNRKTHLYLFLTFVFMKFLAYTVYLPYWLISDKLVDFVMCYYGGGYIANYKNNINWEKISILFCIYIAIFFWYDTYWRSTCSILFAPSEYSYIDVVSPFICCLTYSFLLFLIFVNINVEFHPPLAFIGTAFDKLASSTMDVYIFQSKIISLSFTLAETFWWNNWSRKGFLVFSMIDSVIIFSIGFLISLVRQKAYKCFESSLAKFS